MNNVEPVQSVKDLDYAKAGIEAIGVSPTSSIPFEPVPALTIGALDEAKARWNDRMVKAEAQRISEEKKWATDFIKAKPAPWKCANSTCKTPTAGSAMYKSGGLRLKCVACFDVDAQRFTGTDEELGKRLKPRTEPPAYHGPRETVVGGYVWRPGARYGQWK
jgi:hypothetical protein